MKLFSPRIGAAALWCFVGMLLASAPLSLYAQSENWNTRLSTSDGGFWKKRVAFTLSISDELLAEMNRKNAELLAGNAGADTEALKEASKAGMNTKLVPKEFVFTLVTPEEKAEKDAENTKKSEDAEKSGSALLLPIAGAQAEAIRVCDEKQTEYMFEILDANRMPQHEGTLASGSQLIIPIELTTIPQNSTFYVYYDNFRAWLQPDWWTVKTFTNGGFEEGTSSPKEWVLDSGDETHQISWVDDCVKNGKKAIRTVVAEGAEASWIGARQNGITVRPGERYRLTGNTKGEKIAGYAGWFYHIGNAGNGMIGSGMLTAGEGTFENETSAEFTVPEDCDRLTIGTVLRGTGAAWYDDAKLVLLSDGGSASNADISCAVGNVEEFPLTERFPSKTDANGALKFDARAFFGTNDLPRFAFVKIVNDSDEIRTTTVNVNASLVSARWHVEMNTDSVEILGLDGKPLPFDGWDSNIFITPTLPAKSVCYFILAEKATAVSRGVTARKERDKMESDSAFPGTSLQNQESENRSESISAAEIAGLEALATKNLVKNADFEKTGEDGSPEGWEAGPFQKGITFRIAPPFAEGESVSKNADFGKNCAEVRFEPDVKPGWNGWRQTVKINPDRTYFCGVWVKSAAKGGTLSMHVHFLDANRQNTASGSMTSVSAPSRGENQWTFVSGNLRAPAEAEYMSLQLTVNENGVFCYDNVLVTEMELGTPERFQGGSTGIFQVPAIVKVFPDSTYPRNPAELQNLNFHPVTTAKNEEETVQFALRYSSDRAYQVELMPAASADGKTVLPTELYAVATVPVKHVTSYYNTKAAKWFRKLPGGNGNADGWPGYWPDPMIRFRNLDAVSGKRNASSADLEETLKTLSSAKYTSDAERVCRFSEQNFLEFKAWETRALCVIVKTGKDIPSGLYSGKIRFRNLETGKITYIPYSFDVKDFAIPDAPVCGAIYDCRPSHMEYWNSKDGSEVMQNMIEFLASKRLASDRMREEPKFKYNKETGEWTADFTEFDAACRHYFNDLKVRWSYLPGNWYCFGWGMPPKSLEGEQPYEGEWPFADADRSKLRPEYKKLYQGKLRLMWNHVKEQGWADRFVLYISDEPFYSKPEIIAQMQACCRMIQEVAPDLPIYSSTWGHVPEWDGYITAWGIGHYGRVPEEQLKKSKDRGDHIWWTTDGQMCTDTPFCATERLLPYWCVKYGADAYEFWGASWYTYDPYKYGWHSYIHQSDQPGVEYYVLYPNGDGYIFYPDKLLGVNEIVTSIRLEQAREGVEDAAYLVMLRDEITRVEGMKTLSDAQKQTLQNAKNTLAREYDLVHIPNAGGRFTSHYLPNPEEVDEVKALTVKLIEELRKF